MLGQGELAAVVAAVHAADLRDGDVALVGEDDGVVGDELEEGRGRLARGAAGEVARVVLDAVADAGRLEHLEVEVGALFQALGLEQLALVHELVEALFQLDADLLDGLPERRLGRDVVAVGVDADAVHAAGALARERVELGDALELLAEEREAPGAVFQVGGPELEPVAADAEGAALERGVVAAVLLGDEVGHDLALVVVVAGDQVLGHGAVGLDRADAVDARDRGDDDHVVAFEERPGGRVAHPVDLFVDLRLLLDVGVRARHVGLGLVVVVVGDEVLDRVVGEEALELAVKLRGQRLVGGEDDRGALRLLDDLGHGVGLAGAGGAEQDLVALAGRDALGQLGDGGGLVAGGLELGLHDEAAPALELGAGQHVGTRGQGVGVVVGHRLPPAAPQGDRFAPGFKPERQGRGRRRPRRRSWRGEAAVGHRGGRRKPRCRRAAARGGYVESRGGGGACPAAAGGRRSVRRRHCADVNFFNLGCNLGLPRSLLTV